jgi:uncharacterized protein (TIGR00369 family)
MTNPDRDTTRDGRGPAVQDLYPDDFSRCYGCGRLNPHGHQIKSYWEGEELVARFTPQPYHLAVPGFVYGGLLASLIDCHGIAAAVTATERAAGRQPGAGPAPLYVTASLRVDYLRPTPLGPELELRARVKEVGRRKCVAEVRVLVEGDECVRGEVVGVQVPAAMHGSYSGARSG